jgi:hypothetical protein
LINTAGTIAGNCFDSEFVWHGWANIAGNVFVIDVQGAGTGVTQGTQINGLNAGGVLVGNYIDGQGASHGFLRSSLGSITSFDVLGAGTGSGQGTVPDAINQLGIVTGHYYDASANAHGFVRLQNGRMIVFDAPGAGGGFNQGTFPVDINVNQQITGSFVDAKGLWWGFVRQRNGSFITLAAPGAATNSTGPEQGTLPIKINRNGTVAGAYCDSAAVFHGFVWNPN